MEPIGPAEQVEELTRLRDRLRQPCRTPAAQVDTAELLRTIESMSLLERHVDARGQHATARPARNLEQTHLRTTHPPTELAGWDPALMSYLDRALRALDKKEHEHAE